MLIEMDTRKEIWKDIDNYPNYQVSNFGNVKSLKNNKLLRLSAEEYKKCFLYCNGKRKTFRVHRLVAQAFLPNPNSYEVVNHIDGNKYNNCVENLEWCTYSYNTKHTYEFLGRTAYFKGKNRSEETNKKISIANKGKSKSKEHIQKLKDVKRKNAKCINQYDKNNNYIKTWNCAIEIEENLGIKASNIIRNCTNKRPSAGGYVWRYANE